jgi:hypothetical protein
MVKKTKRKNRMRGGFSWPWSKKVDEYGNPVVEDNNSGFWSYFTSSNDNPQSADTTNSSYFGLENIKMPEMPEITNPFASDNSTVGSAIPTTNSTVASVAPIPNSTVGYVTPTTNSTVGPIGGRKKRRSMRMKKGGYRGLGLTYYATPVDGIRVAEPTYMEYYTGGKRSKKTRKQMRKKCKKNCHKSHRHIR